jgi:hypothetical protein
MLSMMNGCPRWSFLTVPLLAALGCSDPVPRPPQGNLTLSVQKPVSGALTCPVPGKTYVVGNPDGPNSSMAGDRLIDGENGATIKCSVKGSGPFNFSATIKARSSESDMVTLTITNGVINADKLTGTASVGVYTPQLAGTFTSTEGGCTAGVVAGNVKPGSLWATISCPIINYPSTGQACSVGTTTTFVLENCDGS